MKSLMKICFVALIAPAFTIAADSAPQSNRPASNAPASTNAPAAGQNPTGQQVPEIVNPSPSQSGMAPGTSNPTVGQGNELTGTVEAFDAKANTINVRNADGTISQIKVSKTTALSNGAGNKAAVNSLKNGDRIVYVRDNKGGIKTIQVKEGESTIR